MLLRVLLLAVVVGVLGFPGSLGAAVQDPEPEPMAPSQTTPYPPERVATTLRFYNLKGDVAKGPMETAITNLGRGAKLLYGPEQTRSRPGDSFVIVQAPADAKDKDVLRAIKRGSNKVERLVVTVLDREFEIDRDQPGRRSGMGDVRDQMVGLAPEIRWFEKAGPYALFFHVGKRFDAVDVVVRLAKFLDLPLPSDKRRDLLRESFQWDLAGEASTREGEKLEKAIEKLDGVKAASLDVETMRLSVTVELADLALTGPGFTVFPEMVGGRRGAGGTAGIPFRPRFLVNPVLDLLEKRGLELPSEEEQGGAEIAGG